MKPNILLIHRSLGLGGAEKIFAFLSNCLAEEGYNVEVLLLSEQEKTLSLNKKIKVSIKNCYFDSPIMGKNMLDGLRSLHFMADTISKEANSFNANLIICFDLRILLALRLVIKRIAARILFSERADPYQNPKYWVYILKNTYKRIDYVVFQTQNAANFYGKCVKDKCCIIPNPAFPRNGELYEIENDKKQPYIFSAGRFQYRKGFDLLIKAFDLISTDFPEYKLIIYGEGEEEQKYRDLIRNYNLSTRVELEKPMNGVVERNINATLFVLPSRSEGIPNILIEAIIEGIPCVASKCSPGGAELISDNGKYCILAENNDYRSLAEKIRFALMNYDDLLNNAVKAKEGMKRFEPNEIKSSWIDAVERTLKKKGE